MVIIIPECSIKIRSIIPSEFGDVLDVYRQCEDFLALGPVSTASMEMVLQDIELSKAEGGIFCGIYAANEKMIGVVDFVPKGFQANPHTAFLSLLMTAAPFRGRRIGKVVVEAIEKEMVKDPEITTILAGVQVNNPRAVKFWQSKGYRIISGPQLMPDQTTVFGLQKNIEYYVERT